MNPSDTHHKSSYLMISSSSELVSSSYSYELVSSYSFNLALISLRSFCESLLSFPTKRSISSALFITTLGNSLIFLLLLQ